MTTFQVISDLIQGVVWPVATVVLVWAFYKPLSEAIGRLRSAKAGGAEVHLDAEQHASRVLEVTLGSSDSSGEDSPGVADPQEPTVQNVSTTREGLEELLATFTRAGWAAGTEGRGQPAPKLEWDDQGNPRVEDWTELSEAQQRMMRISEQQDDDVRALEEEIKELLEEFSSGNFGAGPLHEIPMKAKRLKDRRKRLERIKPTSVWLQD